MVFICCAKAHYFAVSILASLARFSKLQRVLALGIRGVYVPTSFEAKTTTLLAAVYVSVKASERFQWARISEIAPLLLRRSNDNVASSKTIHVVHWSSPRLFFLTENHDIEAFAQQNYLTGVRNRTSFIRGPPGQGFFTRRSWERNKSFASKYLIKQWTNCRVLSKKTLFLTRI